MFYPISLLMQKSNLWRSKWEFKIAISLTPVQRKYYKCICKFRHLAEKIKQAQIRKIITSIPKYNLPKIRINYAFAKIHSLFHKKRCTFQDGNIYLGIHLISLHMNKNIHELHTEHKDNIALTILFKRNLPNTVFRKIIKYIGTY